jgi:hypothetical protein
VHGHNPSIRIVPNHKSLLKTNRSRRSSRNTRSGAQSRTIRRLEGAVCHRFWRLNFFRRLIESPATMNSPCPR